MTMTTAPIGPHITAAGVPEWQQLAWAYAAADAAVDIADIAAVPGWQQQAVDKFGQAASERIHLFDALMTIRFGPESSPPSSIQPPADTAAATEALPVEAPGPVDTADGFARTVQHLTSAHDNDWELRDEAILALALDYAGQFLPAGRVVQPPVSQHNGAAR